MPTPSLTRQEAADRTERVHPHRCEVDLDLTGAPDAARRTFPVEVAWTFSFDRADGPDETFLDFTGEVLELEINGRSLSAEEIAALLAGAPSAGRVAFHLAALAPGTTLPAPLVPLALNAALLGAEALPRGAQVEVDLVLVRG